MHAQSNHKIILYLLSKITQEEMQNVVRLTARNLTRPYWMPVSNKLMHNYVSMRSMRLSLRLVMQSL